jgi:hypothetical protein
MRKFVWQLCGWGRVTYETDFGKQLGQQDWVPHKVCKTCMKALRYWTQGRRKGLPFGVLMTWS